MASEDLEESHTFRCEIADFKDFLNGKTQYRYEIACGDKFGEKVLINFEMYLPSKEASNYHLKGTKFENKNHSPVDYIGLKAGVDELIQKPISLLVVPRLLKGDCSSVHHYGASRQIKLNLEKQMIWNQFVKVDTIHVTRGILIGNKVIIEFDVRLFPHQKSILVKPVQESMSPTRKSTSSSQSQSQTIPRSNARSSSGRSSNGAAKGASDKLTNTEDDILILDEKPNDVIKLEAMHQKLSLDLRSVLMSQDRADVTFKVKDDTSVKGHRLILAARSQALSEMLSDENKKEDGNWVVEAEDLEPEIMKTILEYIYTGKLGLEFDKHVHQLLIAAHKFQLRELVDYLDLKVPDLLTVENIADFLLLSKQMELKHLEQVMTRYFVQHRTEVIQTKGFLELREKNPGILVDWLLALN
jgi:hypothetical protein